MTGWNGATVRRLKPVVIDVYGIRCWLCGKGIDLALFHPHPGSFSIDHVVPRSKGGSNHISNLRPAHRRCNLRRGDRPASTVRPARPVETGPVLKRLGP